ncbi:MAG: hypothetical protein P8N52_06435 [Crocinitomicaceae bacterium]|nr:hypothetical protein [Crocinitomicaceae bacterium]
MRNTKVLKTGIQTTLVLGVIWTIFFIASNAYNNFKNNNLKYIPAESDLIIQIDANQILKNSIKGVLTTEDNKLLELIQETRAETSKTNGKESGIILNAKTILFSILKDEKRFYGALFNIKDQNDFKNYFTQKKYIGIATTSDVGLIVTTRTPSKLTALAESLLQGKHASIELKNSSSPIAIWTKRATKQKRLDIQVEQGHIHLSGEIFTPHHTARNFKPLSQDGFHTTIAQIPTWINDTIQSQIDHSIPSISGVSFNYFGTEIIEEPNFILAPEADVLIQFETPFHLDSCIESLHEKMIIDSVNPHKFYIGHKEYYANQISKNLIFIGTHDYDSIQTTTKQSVLHISGDPTRLTQINGNGMFKYLLGIIPIYGASKQLASKIQSFDVELTKKDENTLTVTGDVILKEGENAYIEAIRFLLIGQFI